MGRKAKPWYRKQNRTWYVNHHGKQVNLGKDKEAAEKAFHKLMAADEPVRLSGYTTVELLDKFLVWCKANRSEATFDNYSKHLQGFIDSLKDQNLLAAKTKPHHVNDWVADKTGWGASYTRGAMGAIQRAFNWAVKQGYIDKSPLLGMERPAAERREACPTEKEFQKMLEKANPKLKDVLMFMRLTGCRVHEMRIAKPEYLKAGRLEFPVKKSKGKKRARIIYLNDAAMALVQKGMGGEFIFTNTRGNPWKVYALNCAMRRLSKETGFHYCLTSLRHMTTTAWLEGGMDHVTAANLLGHVDATMISRVYSHIGERSNYLQEQINKAG